MIFNFAVSNLNEKGREIFFFSRKKTKINTQAETKNWKKRVSLADDFLILLN